MEKNKKELIFFMPSMDGGGVEKNLVIIANYFVKKLPKVSLITYDKKFNYLFELYLMLQNDQTLVEAPRSIPGVLYHPVSRTLRQSID